MTIKNLVHCAAYDTTFTFIIHDTRGNYLRTAGDYRDTEIEVCFAEQDENLALLESVFDLRISEYWIDRDGNFRITTLDPIPTDK